MAVKPRVRPPLAILFAALAGLAAGPCGAAEEPDLARILVTPGNAFLGEAGAASEGTVTAAQLESRPLLRPAEVLEAVPGLVISQHSGDGKANQYYLRGFNLDHGTDFATSVDGMPVNLPSHAHGQGYSDLQFLIPELVAEMRYRKGPYAADVGDFSTAGSASIRYVRMLDRPFAEATAGQGGYRRMLVAGSPPAADGRLLYALEWTQNDGPWTTPERLGKLNGLLRLSEGAQDNGWSVAAMAYRAAWTATDQVPARALEAGLARYGSLDPSDGGQTHRYSLSGEWSRRDVGAYTRANAYAIDYGLDLWSNFTYCLNDMALTGACDRGDQFDQVDRRRIFGFEAAHGWFDTLLDKPADLTLGIQGRYDDIGNVGLYATAARQRWGTIRQDRVKQGSLGVYGEARVQWLERFSTVFGLRGDLYRFDVASDTPQNSGRAAAAIASPKLALILGPWHDTEYYANLGYGFHGNDARGVVAKVNPDFRDTDPATGFGRPAAASTPLARARGAEIGIRTAPAAGLQSTLALWRLDLASELVFAGDAGTTAPSFPSRRSGIEWSNLWRPAKALSVDADFALSRARYASVDATVPGNRIPGAIERAVSLGVAYDARGRWSGEVRLRYFGPRPLTEDDSVRSAASTLVSLRASYRPARDVKLSLDVFNLFDRKVSDIDYFYASQLRGEALPVSDVHTHPAEPRSLRVSLRLAY